MRTDSIIPDEKLPAEILKQLPDAPDSNQEQTDESQGQPVESSNQFTFHRVGMLTKNIDSTNWLIDDFIESNTLALCFAPPESYKSFFAVDVAASIATGMAWHGLNVQQGAVFYIAGEGMAGLKKRFRAWEIQHKTDTEMYPLFLSSGSGDFLNMTNVAHIIKQIKMTIQDMGVTPRLIVIDTLARNFGGGDENSTQAMNQFITNLDTVRKIWDCTILIVHHTGHSENDRGRGSSALRAAVDTEYKLTRQEETRLVSVKCKKMKDAERPNPRNFELHIVELGVLDDRGRQINSGVLLETDKEVEEALKKGPRLTENHEALLQAVRSRTEAGHSTKRALIRDDLKAHGFNINAFSKWIEKLVKDGLLMVENDCLYPIVST